MQNTLRVLSMVLVVAILVVCGANSDDSFEHKAVMTEQKVTEAEQELLATVHVWKRSTMRSLLSTKRWRRTTKG
jgi:hypothetical protein